MIFIKPTMARNLLSSFKKLSREELEAFCLLSTLRADAINDAEISTPLCIKDETATDIIDVMNLASEVNERLIRECEDRWIEGN